MLIHIQQGLKDQVISESIITGMSYRYLILDG